MFMFHACRDFGLSNAKKQAKGGVAHATKFSLRFSYVIEILFELVLIINY